MERAIYSIFSRSKRRCKALWTLPLTGERKPFALTHSEFTEIHAKFSPNGRWIAYESNETGRTETYVQPFPQGEGKWQVSNNAVRNLGGAATEKNCSSWIQRE